MTAHARMTHGNHPLPLDDEGPKCVLTERAIERLSLSAEREKTRQLLLEVGPHSRPVTRGDCGRMQRPCVLVSCVWNLYCDVTRAGSLRLNRPGLEPDEVPPGQSCALDLADSGPHSLAVIGQALNVARQRIEQIEVRALARLADEMKCAEWKEIVG